MSTEIQAILENSSVAATEEVDEPYKTSIASESPEPAASFSEEPSPSESECHKSPPPRRKRVKKASPVPEGHTCKLCGTSKTPLWRSGPLGSKTLCNACGVKWTKGKLNFDSETGKFTPIVQTEENRKGTVRRRTPSTPIETRRRKSEDTAAYALQDMTSIKTQEEAEQANLSESNANEAEVSKSNGNANVGRKRSLNGSFMTTAKRSRTLNQSNGGDQDEMEDDLQQDDAAEQEDSPTDFEDDSSDEEDDELEQYEDYYRNNGEINFSSTNAVVDKVTPIILRACNNGTNWNNKELQQLADELRRFYELVRTRSKLIKRDYKRLKEYEHENGYYFVPKKKIAPKSARPTPKQKICGVVNSRGKPCQRTGYCPFHHTPRGKSFLRNGSDLIIYDESYTQVVMMAEQSDDEARKVQLSKSLGDKEMHIQISCLLMAAAALERKEVNKKGTEDENQRATHGQNNELPAPSISNNMEIDESMDNQSVVEQTTSSSLKPPQPTLQDPFSAPLKTMIPEGAHSIAIPAIDNLSNPNVHDFQAPPPPPFPQQPLMNHGIPSLSQMHHTSPPPFHFPPMPELPSIHALASTPPTSLPLNLAVNTSTMQHPASSSTLLPHTSRV